MSSPEYEIDPSWLEGHMNAGWTLIGYHRGSRYGTPMMLLFWDWWRGEPSGEGWGDGGDDLATKGLTTKGLTTKDPGDGSVLEVISFGGELIWQVRVGKRAAAKGFVSRRNRVRDRSGQYVYHSYEGCWVAAKSFAERAWRVWVERGRPDPTLYPLRVDLQADECDLLGPRPAPALTMNSVVRVPVDDGDDDEGLA